MTALATLQLGVGSPLPAAPVEVAPVAQHPDAPQPGIPSFYPSRQVAGQVGTVRAQGKRLRPGGAVALHFSSSTKREKGKKKAKVYVALGKTALSLRIDSSFQSFVCSFFMKEILCSKR